MNEPEFSPKSRGDLQSILEFISRDNAKAAVSFVDQLIDRCRMLSRFPEMGTLREELVPGLRSFAVGNYVIYYFNQSERIRIERVLHGALDTSAIFGE